MYFCTLANQGLGLKKCCCFFFKLKSLVFSYTPKSISRTYNIQPVNSQSSSAAVEKFGLVKVGVDSYLIRIQSKSRKRHRTVTASWQVCQHFSEWALTPTQRGALVPPAGDGRVAARLRGAVRQRGELFSGAGRAGPGPVVALRRFAPRPRANLLDPTDDVTTPATDLTLCMTSVKQIWITNSAVKRSGWRSWGHSELWIATSTRSNNTMGGEQLSLSPLVLGRSVTRVTCQDHPGVTWIVSWFPAYTWTLCNNTRVQIRSTVQIEGLNCTPLVFHLSS